MRSKRNKLRASTLEENKLAELVIERVPSIEKVRMVSSGTEATLAVKIGSWLYWKK